MTKIDALKELAAKVEAGTLTEYTDVLCLWASGDKPYLCQRAYNGSLDAAKALHEAVLPGWTHITLMRRRIRYVAFIATGPEVEPVRGASESLPRAWLLAILRALIAQEESE